MSKEEIERFAKGLKRTNIDFESQWLEKFSRHLDEIVGEEILKEGDAGR